ncbi:alpha/beta-hydrolase [Trichodelitschia bisporula]|uniref:Alpha/beta-hydrolase n=1 Tax=Trichodelitschia bisporula TaxID=703511 RepID=A0A6G1I018_9PEZI|nr:alpha/beta-hydrolase [Trichodelitschia bisporula]
MSSALFRIQEHILPCQHIRQYPHATIDSQEDILHLAIKQYTPLDNPSPQAGDVTIIGTHANAFPKELYEPLWDELLRRSKAAGFRIRSIWIADVAFQGASGVLNESKLGNDPSWYDHPRDLLHMVNHFRASMPRPIIGIGHSMGGNNLVNLSLMHPRLFETLILIDPVIARLTSRKGNISPASASSVRRDRWPSRKVAAEAFLRSKFYQSWDKRVFDLWVKHGLRDLPTKVYPDPAAGYEPEVTLATTKHQEVFTFLRPNLPAKPGSLPKALTHPDVPSEGPHEPFYRPEPLMTFKNLPHLRPSVLYIFGEISPLSEKSTRDEKMAVTGVGESGSGGAPAGRVRDVVVAGAGHLIPMEKVGETADLCSGWLDSELKRWAANEHTIRQAWARVPPREKYTLTQEVLDTLSGVMPKRVSKPKL